MPPPVGIGLTELPNSGVAKAPPSGVLTKALHVINSEQWERRFLASPYIKGRTCVSLFFRNSFLERKLFGESFTLTKAT